MNGHSTMTAEGRRKVIEALAGQDGWTSSSIAEALGISEAVVNADIADIDVVVPADIADLVAPAADPGKSHRTALLEAYAAAPAGLTAQEAGKIAGLDRYAASKRVPDLRKRGYVEPLAGGGGEVIKRDRCAVLVITQHGRDCV